MKDNNFKEVRLTLGLTQQKMADKCGIHLQTWVKWERGEQKPPAIAKTHVKSLLDDMYECPKCGYNKINNKGG